MNMKYLVSSIGNIKSIYTKKAFDINTDQMDSEFEPIQAEFTNMKIDLNTNSLSKHVTDIEHYFCVNKDRARAC